MYCIDLYKVPFSPRLSGGEGNGGRLLHVHLLIRVLHQQIVISYRGWQCVEGNKRERESHFRMGAGAGNDI